MSGPPDARDSTGAASRRRALIIDLNNFSTFPTLAVGILVAALRDAGVEVRVLCPLAHGVVVPARERQESTIDHLLRRLHHTGWGPLRLVRDAGRGLRAWWSHRPDARTIRLAQRELDAGPDVVLLSAYLQHHPSVVEIGRLAAERGIPVLLGGPVFNMADTAEAWRETPGLTAIFGGEADLVVPDLVAAACEGGDLLAFPGVLLPDGRRSPGAPPLRPLDRAPQPDYGDFPWHLYRFRVVPVMTGRGCQWNRCSFCSDVVSASGRTFRTRSVEGVLQELAEQARRHDTRNFIFLDLKLNSNPGMLRGLVEGIQQAVPGAEWIGTVHVDTRRTDGLSAPELAAAAAAGMRRVSFGLETGSQRLLDAMDKGATVARNARFIRDADEAGLSVRCTMFKGYPGETVEDLKDTADFLEAHAGWIDRVRYNDFTIHADTPIHAALAQDPGAYPDFRVTGWDHRNARAGYARRLPQGYRRQNERILKAVHAINRKPVRCEAAAFDGLM